MAKKRRRKSARGCKRVHYKGHTRTVCRDRKGRITSVSKAGGRKRSGRKKHYKRGTCPATFAGRRVFKKRLRKGGTRCAVKLKSGRIRFVKARR